MTELLSMISKEKVHKKVLFLILLTTVPLGLFFQSPFTNTESTNVKSTSDNRLTAITSLLNRLANPELTAAEKTTEIDNYIAEQTPYGFPVAHDNRICFIYRGEAQAVSVEGDFLLWEYPASLIRASNSDFFYLMMGVEEDARIEYVYRVDGTYMMDPLNPYSIPNSNSLYYYGINASEFFMPAYVDDGSWRFNTTLGTLLVIPDFNYTTQNNWTRTIHIYLPPGYDPNGTKHYKTLYVADGSSYIDSCHAVNVLDYLSYHGIMDLIAVFVDPLKINGTNYRLADYMGPNCSQDYFQVYNPSAGRFITYPGHIGVCKQGYVEFITTELVPYIDSTYLTINQSEARGYVGASLGAYISTYTAWTRPDVFKLVGAHSGSFWVDPSMIESFRTQPQIEGMRLYLNAGTFEETILNCSKAFAEALRYNQYPGKFRVFHQGHSSGQWRTTLSEMLIFLFTNETSDYSGSPALYRPPPSSSSESSQASGSGETEGAVFPVTIELLTLGLAVAVLFRHRKRNE